MVRLSCSSLELLLNNFSYIQAVPSLQKSLNELLASDLLETQLDRLLKLYSESISIISPELLKSEINHESLGLLHKIYGEMEQVIKEKGEDDRYSFVVVIPIADRPKHLRACLLSLYELCETFAYGGRKDNRFQKVRVLVADDSEDELNIEQHKKIAVEYNEKGLETEYFSLRQQVNQLNKLPQSSRSRLLSILGENEASSFYHKGASIMRNIVYLKLNETYCKDKKQLFYFIDSDQEFKVKINVSGQDENVYLLNYFYELDKIFTQKDVTLLTGKVVGDPPVSPAVMAGNFLDDVIAFLYQCSKLDSHARCDFHGHNKQQVNDASYHDMAELFGFKQNIESYKYSCSLHNEHTNEDCFERFSSELNRFFYGEHPTRKMYYEYEDALTSVNMARTVYTGNYVFNHEGLEYFIPFATLKLRMAGPVLGRIIKSQLAGRFVSANLPMLHKRTYEETGVSEFRSGIEQDSSLLDLSGEYERQYFGDVMLFSIEQLTEMGFPDKLCDEEEVETVLYRVEKSVNQKYIAKQNEIIKKLNRLDELFSCEDHWWNHKAEFRQAKYNLQCFIDNIYSNFGTASKGLALVNNEQHKNKRLQQMRQAINEFSADRASWSDALKLHRSMLTGQVTK